MMEINSATVDMEHTARNWEGPVDTDDVFWDTLGSWSNAPTVYTEPEEFYDGSLDFSPSSTAPVNLYWGLPVEPFHDSGLDTSSSTPSSDGSSSGYSDSTMSTESDITYRPSGENHQSHQYSHSLLDPQISKKRSFLDTGELDRERAGKRAKTPQPQLDTKKFLACPYAKYDPVRYSLGNYEETHYRNCSGGQLRTIAHVKQHLKRVHTQPEFYCPRCYRKFEQRSDSDRHIRDADCQKLPTPKYEGMLTPEQFRVISKKRRGFPDHENWRMIYKVCFDVPDDQVPKNIYAEQPQGDFQHFMDFFRRDAAEQLKSSIMEKVASMSLNESDRTLLNAACDEAVIKLMNRTKDATREPDSGIDE